MSSTETITAEQLAQRLEDLASKLREFPPPGVIRKPAIQIEWFSKPRSEAGPTRDQVRQWTKHFFGPTDDKPDQRWISSDNGDGIELTVFVRTHDEEASK